ncbi:immunity 21 family protein [Micromonospora cathayae]|uniref:Immunity 21 family protein n=1 Tax=Micromonospora cathayae TaxID=3028804 RepID=A0ABY7ZLB5_9ACTN|nr:immunity 21 family protein [Micromonospora sp. HUAS 3]WDZ83082.1 immunity 21 family protein [Micromonospora sp. HUAS 3]
MASLQYTWVSSAGGPLLVAPRSALSLWAGVDSTDGPVESWGDYGRACAIDGFVGLVAVGPWQALVLGDEPAMTTYLPAERLFLRWAAAYEEDDLVSAARRAVHDGVQWDADEDVRWVVDGSVVMFDSAWPGAELEPDNHLVIDLHPGEHRVRAAYLADGDSRMILVQLQPVSEPAQP